MVIDTETHIFYYARSAIANPGVSRTAHYRWHEHDVDLLLAEMDRAEVDRTFLISYDAEDTRWSAEYHGFGMEDFAGGRSYTLQAFHRHRDRFYWFNTLKDPRKYPLKQLINRDLDDGATGFKLFPAYVHADLTSSEWIDVFQHLEQADTPLLVSFETLDPPRSFSSSEYFRQLDYVLTVVPNLRVTLMHAGCVDPLGPSGSLVQDLCRKYPDVYLSMAMPGAVWDDGWEYPFQTLLKRVKQLQDTVGSNRLMWATDWPWFGDRFLYSQGIDCFRFHADFLSSKDLTQYLGDNALDFLLSSRR